MCSIYGAVGKNYLNIEKPFSKELHHRGPDDCGIFYDNDEKIALGHTRLSIIDLTNHAHQPMCSQDENYVLVFNGEIYNYKELKKSLAENGVRFTTNSDTEVVLKSYMKYGADCVNHFRGMFAFCVYDKQKKELFLARDRFGIKPLIYTFLENQFIFSSEIRPFLKSKMISKKISYKALGDYFRFGSIQQPETILDGFYQLMPGHFMVVKNGWCHKIEKYYDYVNESQKLKGINNYDEAVKRVREELETATRYHMVADVEVGAFLSGGVDSTAVVAMMKKYSDKKINTFSVGFRQKTNVEDETDIATRTSKFLGCNHKNIKIDDGYIAKIFDDFIDSIDQPSIDGINTYIVSYETAKEMKVALSGLGGDEIFAGYPHFKLINECAKKQKSILSYAGELLNRLRPNRFTGRYGLIGMNEGAAVDKQRSMNNDVEKILRMSVGRHEVKMDENVSSIQTISKSEIDNYMLNTLLRDNDVLSMAHSLEVRPILLDHKLVELAFSLADDYKVRNGRLKAVFIDSIKDIIPPEVWQRKKTGFEMPFKKWMNGTLNEKYLNVVENKKHEKLFKEEYINKLKYRVKNRKLKRIDWMTFIFLTWFEMQDVQMDVGN